MSTLETYYTYAKLSQAAYIDLSGIGNPLDKQSIVDAASSDAQQRVAKALAENIFGVANYDPSDYWTMLSPYYKTSESTGHSDPTSGFAGMLLSNPTYGKVLAIAGTEPGTNDQTYWDLLNADIGQIGTMGAAFKQVVSLFNYVQELKALAGATDVLRLVIRESNEIPTGGVQYVSQFIPGQAEPIYYWLEAHYDGQGQGKINDGEKLTVTGHSLGGHLAALAVALFPETFTTAYTYNAPGYNPPTNPNNGADKILALFTPYGAHPLAVGSISNRVVTLEAEDAIPGDDNEIVSSSGTGTPFSTETYVTTEKVTHDIGHMAEGLALQAILAKLDPGMTLQKASSILTAATAQTGETYEKLLEDLNYLVTGTTIALPRTEPSSLAIDAGDFSSRNTFFVNYLALQNNAAFKSLIGKVQIVAPPTSAEEARADFGAFLSLVNLTPFALKPNDATAASILKNINSTNSELALQWAEDSVLTAEEIAQGEANYSDLWLADRAAMRSWIVKRNREDSTDIILEKNAPDQFFYDKDSQTTIRLGSVLTSDEDRRHFIFGSDATDIRSGGNKNDRLYGEAGDDTLDGGKGNDWLEGGAGADKLTGGEGADRLYGGADNDTLVGGEGTDTYVIKTGDGIDTLLDADGAGVITLDGGQIKGRAGTDAEHWQTPAADTWLDTENNITYTRITEGGETRLLIHQGSNNLIVRNWQEGGLGITLGTAAEPPADPVTAGIIEGDHPVIDQNANAGGIQPGYDSLNNLKTDYGVEVERQDILFGSSGNNLIRVYINIDYLSGGVGDDVLEGGEGNAENDVFYREAA